MEGSTNFNCHATFPFIPSFSHKKKLRLWKQKENIEELRFFFCLISHLGAATLGHSLSCSSEIFVSS